MHQRRASHATQPYPGLFLTATTVILDSQDGGYHVPFAHKSLAAGLQLQDYQSAMHERVSIQRVPPALDADARLSGVLVMSVSRCAFCLAY